MTKLAREICFEPLKSGQLVPRALPTSVSPIIAFPALSVIVFPSAAKPKRRGIAPPHIRWQSRNGGALPRLTSGGKAETARHCPASHPAAKPNRR